MLQFDGSLDISEYAYFKMAMECHMCIEPSLLNYTQLEKEVLSVVFGWKKGLTSNWPYTPGSCLREEYDEWKEEAVKKAVDRSLTQK